MAMANNILSGQASEWALLRRHPAEDCFGIQIAGGNPDLMKHVSTVLNHETSSDFVDLNCGCPIDAICRAGAGSCLLTKSKRLCDIVKIMANNLSSRCITVKVRIGWDEKNPTTHKLIPELQGVSRGRIAAIMV
jgi:tRNA-dihydrouridine synthase 3